MVCVYSLNVGPAECNEALSYMNVVGRSDFLQLAVPATAGVCISSHSASHHLPIASYQLLANLSVLAAAAAAATGPPKAPCPIIGSHLYSSLAPDNPRAWQGPLLPAKTCFSCYCRPWQQYTLTSPHTHPRQRKGHSLSSTSKLHHKSQLTGSIKFIMRTPSRGNLFTFKTSETSQQHPG